MINGDAKKRQKINKKPDESGCTDIDHKPYDSRNMTASALSLSLIHPLQLPLQAPSNPCTSYIQCQSNIIVNGSGSSHKHDFTACHRVYNDNSSH
ncbi:hypothetical protein ABVT39_006233 [Epinephelus coioides]